MRLTIFASIISFAMGLGAALAAGDDAAGGGTSSSEDTYECHVPGGEETPFCVCTSLHACNEMAEDGVCDRPQGRGVTNDTQCNDAPDVEDTAAVGSCFCTWEPLEGEQGGRTDRRPTFGDAPGGAADTNAPRRNETVPARRGSAPDQQGAADDQDVQETEEAAPTERRVRDHRR